MTEESAKVTAMRLDAATLLYRAQAVLAKVSDAMADYDRTRRSFDTAAFGTARNHVDSAWRSVEFALQRVRDTSR